MEPKSPFMVTLHGTSLTKSLK